MGAIKRGKNKFGLTAQEETFALCVASGMKRVESALKAYPSTRKWKRNSVSKHATMLMRRPELADRVRALLAKAAEKNGLSVEKTLREIARVAYSDIRRLYDENGSLRAVHELDDDTAAAVASIEIDEITEDSGGAREELEPQPNGGALKRKIGRPRKAVVGFTRKIKLHDKNSALEKAMKYHGLYREDNAQIGEAASMALSVAFGRE